MLEGERLAFDGRQCFTQCETLVSIASQSPVTHFYYIIDIGPRPSILVNDLSARG